MELLLGCGADRARRIEVDGRKDWSELVTLDNNPDHEPDVLWDLTSPEPLPFADDTFDEIHAYEVLEHIGQQGDYRTFFRQFSDYWRVLKAGGVFAGTCPSYRSRWAWGDPSHTRVLTAGTFVFLSQAQYAQQVGKTRMSDFRSVYHADFEIAQDDAGRLAVSDDGEDLQFVLVAIKPARRMFDADAEGRTEECAEHDVRAGAGEARHGREADAARTDDGGREPGPELPQHRGGHRQAAKVA